MVGGAIGVDKNISCNPIAIYLYKVREEHARQQESDYSHVFRKKSSFDLIRLSCIIIGIEYAYAAETAFVSPILLEIGIDHKHMTMVWGLSPLLGLFASPFLGSISDRCRLSMGRRRPLIIILSIGIFLGLLLVPHGKELGVLLGDAGKDYFNYETLNSTVNISQFGTAEALKSPDTFHTVSNYKFAVIVTILGTILLDFSSDICQIPSRSYLLDVCIPSDHAIALSVFSTMAGIGAAFGYAMCAIDWELTSFGQFLGGNVITVFTIVTIILIISFLVTITSFREIPLPLIEKDPMLKPLTVAIIKKEVESGKNDIVYYVRETAMLEFPKRKSDLQEHFADNTFGTYKRREYNNGIEENIVNMNENLSAAILNSMDNDEGQDSKCEEIFEEITLSEYFKSIVIMPTSMGILCLTNLFAWMAYLSYCLYFTDFVGEAVFGGVPSEDSKSESNIIYEAGVRFGCWGLTICATSCSIHSVFTEKLIRIFNLRIFYIGSMLIYVAGMFVLAIWPTKVGVLILSTTSGIQYSTLMTVPYILVAQYHANDCFNVINGINIPMKQKRGLGTDVAIVTSMVFVAQLIISLGIGALVSYLNTTAGVLYAASVFNIMASISAFFVLYLE